MIETRKERIRRELREEIERRINGAKGLSGGAEWRTWEEFKAMFKEANAPEQISFFK